MTVTYAPAAMHKVHDGLSYTIELKPDDSSVYLDIDQLGLHHHQVKTSCDKNDWDGRTGSQSCCVYDYRSLQYLAQSIFVVT